MARLCRWLEEVHAIPRSWPNGVPREPKNGKDPDGHNRNPETWRKVGGHYGHCHVPENDHWDPGYTHAELSVVISTPEAIVDAPALMKEAEAELLDTAFAEQQRQAGRPYYDAAIDRITADRYYASIDCHAPGDALFDTLSGLVIATHERILEYSPARQLYPWVDLQPDGRLKSIYTDDYYEPVELIAIAATRGGGILCLAAERNSRSRACASRTLQCAYRTAGRGNPDLRL